jgi:S-adenosylmethionine-diacylglycerol 3-amino-3-carboxypropyl transferase
MELKSPVSDSVLAREISYAQCWEDPAVLLDALVVGPEDDVLSVCSAGDNSFALAIAGARSVTCVDLSLPQLALAELKLAAARALPIQSFRALLGLDEPGRRVWFYHQVRDGLSETARRYWDAHEETIRLGLLGQGRFDRYIARFRETVLPWVHDDGVVRGMLACRTLEEQAAYFHERWDTWRWRGLFRIFFSRFVMARAGRSPEHFAQVEGSVSDRFLARSRHALTEIPVSTNFFAQLMLGGRFPDLEAAHPYLSTAGHARLRAVADRIRFVHAPLEELAGSETFSAFNYSNIFEYVSAEHHGRLLEATLARARPGARIAYWNLLVPRSRPASLADRLERREAESAALLARDRAFVYGGFNLEVVL